MEFNESRAPQDSMMSTWLDTTNDDESALYTSIATEVNGDG